MAYQSEAATQVDHAELFERSPQPLEDHLTKTPPRVKKTHYGVTKNLSGFTLQVDGLPLKLKADTKGDPEVSIEGFSLQLEVNRTETTTTRVVNREVSVKGLIDLRHLNTRIYYLVLLRNLFIFILVAILVFLIIICIHKHTGSRLEHHVSFCELPTGSEYQRNLHEQLGTTFAGKIFYTLMEGDNVTSEEVYGIESTLKYNPNTTCYIMILSTPTTDILKPTAESKREIYNLIEKYDNAILLNVDGEKYFRASPLYNLWKHFRSNSPLIQFAARVLIIWKFGGTTYDSHLLTLGKDSISALPGMMDTVVMDLNNGLIMSAQQKCDTFILEVVKALAIVGKYVHTKTFKRKVLSLALINFCDEVQTTFNNGSMALKLACAGVTVLPPELLCYTNQSDPGCTWGYS